MSAGRSLNPIRTVDFQEAFMKQFDQERKPYEQPAIVYETELEVRAGTPVGIPDPLDLTGTK
jgi:hypothetical protein